MFLNQGYWTTDNRVESSYTRAGCNFCGGPVGECEHMQPFLAWKMSQWESEDGVKMVKTDL